MISETKFDGVYPLTLNHKMQSSLTGTAHEDVGTILGDAVVSSPASAQLIPRRYFMLCNVDTAQR